MTKFFIKGLISMPVLIVRIFVFDASISAAYGQEPARAPIVIHSGFEP
jgi:hypothetical protein